LVTLGITLNPGFQGINKMSVSIIFSFAMSFVYLGIGIFLIVSDEIFFFQYVSQTVIGIIIAVYGLVRFYSAFKKKRESEIEDEND